MSSDTLREEVDQLRDRVAELEARLDDNSDTTTSDTPGIRLDYRDKAVLEHVREHGVTRKSQLRDLYISKTDIRDKSTAKDRAKALAKTDAFQEL